MGASTFKPNLTGVPETTLWTLYHRAGEARRSAPIIHDPMAIDLVDSHRLPISGRRSGP